MIPIDWRALRSAAEALAIRAQRLNVHSVWGVPTGGTFAALLVYQSAINGLSLADAPGPGVLVVDDLVDSGGTLREYAVQGHAVDALFRKPHSPGDLAPEAQEIDGWLHFPWEHEGEPTDAVVRLLQYVGEDPTREGLLDTPGRVCRAYRDLTAGYSESPNKILSRVFSEPYDQMVLVRDIHFWSLCEHHLLPFQGQATVGYLPNGKVVGLSKIPRLVHCFSRRLQIQERLTQEIARAIQDNLAPLGVGVVIRANHTCMEMRGVKTRGEMVTSCLLGTFQEPAVRAEFLSLAASST